MLAAWGAAFGCAVGWDAFTMPGETFLPKAGPLGTLLGLLLGGLAMGVVAWNYHFMIRRHPGPGGVYSYATAAFGSDHGFICAWFLCLTYIAIVWADATALVIAARYLLGDILHFGFVYTVAGLEVTLGDLLLSAAGIAVAAAVCCRRALSGRVQAALALVLAGGIALFFCAAVARHGGGGALRSMEPAFSPLARQGAGPLVQVLAIVALSPWLFVGFESISNLSGEFRFGPERSFRVMAAALGTAVAAYALLTAIPAMTPLVHAGDWSEGLARLGGGAYPGFEVTSRSLGWAGTWVMGVVLLASIFTNLVGNTMAAGRLLSAMSDDGALPRWLGGRTRDGAPKNAVLAIAVVSLGISALGRTVIGIIVDIAVVGAGIAYAYTSAAAWKEARKEGNRAGRVLGMCGLVFSVAITMAFVLPNVGADAATMATESYLVVVLWCIAGLVSFVYVFTHDRQRRFGQSTVVWISLLAIVLLMSGLWIRQTTYHTTAEAFEDIVRYHGNVHMRGGLDASGGRYWVGSEAAPDVAKTEDGWQDILRGKLATVNRSIVRNSLVQVGLAVLAFGLMFCLYSILRRRERELEVEKARAKSYFFSTVSHDIRTPLNAIIGFSEMLKAGFRTEEEREQALDAILVSGKTLLGLINDVLDLSKIESGKMEIVPEPTDCPRLLRGVMDAFRVAADKPGLELRCRIGDMPPLMLDPQRLRQIVFNIVGNAVKFTERGHVELRGAYVREKGAETGEFRLVVEDTGCGIGEEDLERIGSAFVQVGSRASRNGGTGLGLAICKELAEAMGGSLGVESELGRGSTFRVTIPGVKPVSAGDGEGEGAWNGDTARDRAAAAAYAGTGLDDRAGERGTDGKGRQRPRQPVKRVLLVDDSKMNLMVLQAHLKHIGDFDIAQASDGREALALLEASGDAPFDLVFTDMWMPHLDGAGLLKAIRANPLLAGLRVVIVTADVELQAHAKELGFDDILFKPVVSDKLLKLVSGT